MGRTWINQETQVGFSDSYVDATVPSSAMETSAVSVMDDLNNIRSVLKRHLVYTDSGNWWDDDPTITVETVATTRGMKQIHQHLAELEQHRFLFRVQILTDLTVAATNTFKVLSLAASETPTEVASVGLGTTLGAIVAELPGDVGTASLVEVAGFNAINPKNLVILRNAVTGDVMLDGGKEVLGLIQCESGVVDGDAFDDATHQVQISFVKENATGDDLIASAIPTGVTSINYSYVRRLNLDDVPEQAFLTGAFVDQSAAVDVTLDNAIDNQSGPATQQQNIQWRIDDSNTLDFQNSDGSVNMLRVAPAAAGDEVEINVDTLDINNVNSVDISNGIIVDSSGTSINVGVTAGQIDAAGLTVASTGSNDLNLNAGLEMLFTDSNRTGSTWSAPVKLTETTAEWDAYEVAFGGEVSLFNAIVQANSAAGHNKAVAVCTSNISANTNVTGAGGSPNVDAQLLNYSTITFLTDVNVYLNGDMLRNGANAAANNDVYPGTTPANGDLMFEFALKGVGSQPDVITMEAFGV